MTEACDFIWFARKRRSLTRNVCYSTVISFDR
jgi:hypothetical protein